MKKAKSEAGEWTYKVECGEPYRTVIYTPKDAWWCALVGQCGYEARKIVKALNVADAAKARARRKKT